MKRDIRVVRTEAPQGLSSQKDVAKYIHEMTIVLAGLAAANGLELLAYILNMASQEVKGVDET